MCYMFYSTYAYIDMAVTTLVAASIVDSSCSSNSRNKCMWGGNWSNGSDGCSSDVVK